MSMPPADTRESGILPGSGESRAVLGSPQPTEGLMPRLALCLFAFACLLAPARVWAQDKSEKAAAPAKKAGGLADETAMMIQFSGKQLLELAEDKQFPESKLDFKPTPEVRS